MATKTITPTLSDREANRASGQKYMVHPGGQTIDGPDAYRRLWQLGLVNSRVLYQDRRICIREDRLTTDRTPAPVTGRGMEPFGNPEQLPGPAPGFFASATFTCYNSN